MTQAELSRRLGRPQKTVNEIVKGKAAITAETAIQLERALGISAEFWTGLESRYREWAARVEAERSLADQVSWIDSFPIADMVKHRLIKRGGTRVETAENLLSFLRVSSPQALDRLNAAASYRSSPAFEASPTAVSAWLRWGEIAAEAVEVSAFDADSFRAALVDIRPLTRKAPFSQVFARVRQMSSAAGVVIVVTPELEGTRLSGAARWIGSKSVIQLTLRHRSNDQFWFTLFHEAGHLILSPRHRDFVDLHEALGGSKLDESDDETLADNFARDLLLPPGDFEQFVREADFSREAVRRYAAEQRVAPGIVVGRLVHDRHIIPGQLRELVEPVNLPTS